MTLHRILATAALVAVALVASAPAAAQASRTWVSGVGDDANPCSRTAPCKTFPGAISKTAAGGEISVLDPGSYGSLTITKSITIDGNGHVAGVLVNGAFSGIFVNAPSTSHVVLRNLAFDGSGGAVNAIRYIAGGSLVLDNVTVRGFQRGVSFDGGAGVTGRLEILRSGFFDNATAVFLEPEESSTVAATLADVRLSGNGAGVRAESGSTVSISGSTISGNTNSGVNAVAPTGTLPAKVSIDDCAVSGNGVGIKSTQPGATVFVSATTVSDNALGLQSANGGVLRSFGDNQVVDNADDGVFTGTVSMR